MISVVVPVFRNTTLVEYCLDHLIRRLPTDAEVIAVDDASGAETVEAIRAFPRVRLISHPANRGNTAAYNTGAAAAQGDILVFADSDILVGDTTLTDFADVLRDDTIGAAGALLLYPQTLAIQHAGVAFDRWILSHVYVGQPYDPRRFAPVEERQAVTAALFACRRATFERVGGFDETYRDGLEDIEFCLRCRELGLRNVISTRSPSLHLESATRGPFKHIRRVYNYVIFFSRWHGRFEVDLPRFIVRAATEMAWPWTNGTAATVVNFCTTPNWPDLIEALLPLLDVVATHNLSGSVAESDAIDLYRQLPIAFHRDPLPLLFIVDHIEQVARNRHWFDQRPCIDLIVDRHANFLVSKGCAK